MHIIMVHCHGYPWLLHGFIRFNLHLRVCQHVAPYLVCSCCYGLPFPWVLCYARAICYPALMSYIVPIRISFSFGLSLSSVYASMLYVMAFAGWMPCLLLHLLMLTLTDLITCHSVAVWCHDWSSCL